MSMLYQDDEMAHCMYMMEFQMACFGGQSWLCHAIDTESIHNILLDVSFTRKGWLKFYPGSILASIWRAYISIYYFILLPKLTSLITTSLKKYGRLASLAFWRKFWLQYIKCLRMFVLFSSIIKFQSFECTILAAKRNPPAALQLFFLIIDVNQIFISRQ